MRGIQFAGIAYQPQQFTLGFGRQMHTQRYGPHSTISKGKALRRVFLCHQYRTLADVPEITRLEGVMIAERKQLTANARPAQGIVKLRGLAMPATTAARDSAKVDNGVWRPGSTSA